MRKHSFAALLAMVGLLVIGGCRKGVEAGRDREKFQGTWGAMSYVENGEGEGQTVDPEKSAVVFVFNGDNVTILADLEDASPKGAFKLDTSAQPRQIDFLSMLGIYEVDGDTLKLCYGPKQAKRPAEFKSPAKSGYIMIEFKRINSDLVRSAAK